MIAMVRMCIGWWNILPVRNMILILRWIAMQMGWFWWWLAVVWSWIVVIKVLILSDAPLEETHQSGTVIRRCLHQQYLHIASGFNNCLHAGCVIVDEVTAASILAAQVLPEVIAFLRFVLHVNLMVLQQLVWSMRKFASILIRTEAEVHEAAAKLWLLLGIFGVEERERLGRRGGRAGGAGAVVRRRGLLVLQVRDDFQHDSISIIPGKT